MKVSRLDYWRSSVSHRPHRLTAILMVRITGRRPKKVLAVLSGSNYVVKPAFDIGMLAA